MKRFFTASFLLATVLINTSCTKNDKDTNVGGQNGDNTYFDMTVDGEKVSPETIHYARAGKTIHLSAFKTSGFPNINVTMTATNENDFRGVYNYTYTMQAGTAIILYGIGDGSGYETHWWDCPLDGPLLMISPGSVKIDTIERNGSSEYITGTINAVVYQPQGNCPFVEVKKKAITAKFRLKAA